MDISQLFLICVIAGFVSLLSPLGWRLLLTKSDTFDVPNHRSSHSRPTLRGGGLAPMSGVLITILLLMMWPSDGESTKLGLLIFAAAVLSGCIGLWEDLRGIPARLRALCQAIIGGILCFTLSLILGHGWIWIPMAVLFFVANVNFTNFMDGVNGISGLHALSTGATFVLVGLISGHEWLVLTGVVLFITFLTFLFWNFKPPGMFLGDVGSYLLGGFTAAIALGSIWSGINPIAVLAPLSIYWVDATYTLLVRMARREPIFEAHRMHVYQRLTDQNLSHLAVASIVAFFTLIAGLAGSFALSNHLIYSLVIIGILIVNASIYLTLPRILAKRKVSK